MSVIRITDRIVDRLRKNCLGHEALVRALQRPMPATATDSEIADEILADLWEEGLKIVPRDKK